MPIRIQIVQTKCLTLLRAVVKSWQKQETDMSRAPKSGFAFHCHHDVLVEFVWDYDERVRDIEQNKPKREVELRLRLFKMIPEERLPRGYKRVHKARAADGKARAADGKAWAADGKARTAYDKAWAAYDKARAAYGKARAAHLLRHDARFGRLHTELCPKCPWDGTTIFPSNS